jgi:hypothetical protein
MKRHIAGWRRLALRWGMGALVLVLLPALGWAQTLKVVKDKDCIRQQAQFFAKPVVTVKRGDQLQKLKVKGDWFQVEFQGKKGWIHKAAVSSPTVRFSTFLGLGQAQAASTEEVALAGKGFTPEVEAGYRQKYPQMNYAAVDLVESFQVPDAQFQAFLKKGDLRP